MLTITHALDEIGNILQFTYTSQISETKIHQRTK